METQGTVKYDASAALTLTNQAQAALSGAADLVIDSPTMFEMASDDLMAVKALQKQVEAQRTAITGPLNAATKAVNDLFRAPKEYLEQAEAALKRPMVAWTAEQERLAAVARREAEEQARKERERLEAIRRQQESEARAAAEAAQAAQAEAQQAAARGDRQAAENAQALAWEQTAKAEEAQAQAQEAALTAEIISITPVALPQAKVSGISGRVNYKAETPDLMALAKAVVAGAAPLQCLLVNEQFLGAQARAMKQTGLLYGVVNIVAERGISARAA